MVTARIAQTFRCTQARQLGQNLRAMRAGFCPAKYSPPRKLNLPSRICRTPEPGHIPLLQPQRHPPCTPHWPRRWCLRPREDFGEEVEGPLPPARHGRLTGRDGAFRGVAAHDEAGPSPKTRCSLSAHRGRRSWRRELRTANSIAPHPGRQNEHGFPVFAGTRRSAIWRAALCHDREAMRHWRAAFCRVRTALHRIVPDPALGRPQHVTRDRYSGGGGAHRCLAVPGQKRTTYTAPTTAITSPHQMSA